MSGIKTSSRRFSSPGKMDKEIPVTWKVKILTLVLWSLNSKQKILYKLFVNTQCKAVKVTVFKAIVVTPHYT